MKAQDIDVSLDDALRIIGGGNHKVLKNKLLHSIELIRKAEKLALLYDPENGFFNTFSGGKDSQAMYHVAKMAGVRFKTHMNFTSVDPPQVIRFVRREYPDVITRSPKKSIFKLAVYEGLLPSMRIRWCCAKLKESAGAGKVTLIGIRKEESSRRARRHEVEVSNKSFSGNFDEFGEWQEEQVAKKEAKLIKKMKREGKKVNEDEFSLTKDNEVRCINGKDSILISPIFEWTEKDVWYFLNEVIKAPHCELYDQGYKRIGCILCPMSTYRQKLKEMQDFPHVKRGWINAIKEIRRGASGRGHTIQIGCHQETQKRMDNGNRKTSNGTCRYGRTPTGVERWTELPPPIPEENFGNSNNSQSIRQSKIGNKRINTGVWAGFRITPLLTAQ